MYNRLSTFVINRSYPVWETKSDLFTWKKNKILNFDSTRPLNQKKSETAFLERQFNCLKFYEKKPSRKSIEDTHTHSQWKWYTRPFCVVRTLCDTHTLVNFVSPRKKQCTFTPNNTHTHRWLLRNTLIKLALIRWKILSRNGIRCTLSLSHTYTKLYNFNFVKFTKDSRP